MPRGKNYVNNNKGLTMQRHKKETRMEKCFYGAGCTRPDCKYLHPSVSPNDDGEQPSKQSREPCMPYLAGLCTFTAKGCHKRHPPDHEVELLIAKYRKVLCRFGETCKTSGCLYVHPGEEGADALLAMKKQAPVVPIGANVPGFPPLVGTAGHGSLPLPNSAWRPSLPTGHARTTPSIPPPMAPSLGAPIMGHSSAPSLQAPPPPRPAWQPQQQHAQSMPRMLQHSKPIPVFVPSNNSSTKALSVNAREFTPGGMV